jgi:ketosteroid isomerase-like protein
MARMRFTTGNFGELALVARPAAALNGRWIIAMSATENKRLMQEIFAGLAVGDSRLFVERMADDFRWTITGTTRWSKIYDGKQAVLNDLLKPLRGFIDGRMRLSAQRMIAEDDLVVVEARGSNTTKSGEPYNNAYCHVFRLEDGKLKELTEYLDTQLVATALRDPA